MDPKIIIADDHSMIRTGMKALLMVQLNCKDVHETDSCSGLMNELKKRPCTHLILDVILSDGSALEIIPVIRKLYPNLKTLVFSMQPEEIYAGAFRQYEIYYYVSKALKSEEISKTLRRFLDGEMYPFTYKINQSNNPLSLLTPRELEVLHYLINGYKTHEIAQTLNLGHSTISTFKKRIFEKTKTSTLAQIYELASLNDLGFYLSTNNFLKKKQ